jgi:glycerophosphoryl diester phosphodiesterase
MRLATIAMAGIAVSCLAVVALAVLALRLIAAGPASSVRSHPYFEVSASDPQVVAHRGGMHEAPENTIHAFRRALAHGADVVEMDVRATADGALVVLHDARVDRTTDGVGRVDELALAQVRSLDAGYRFTTDGTTTPLRGRGVRIPTLAEVLEALPTSRVALEIKAEEGRRLASAMCDVIRAAGAERRALVASFEEEETLAFREACPTVVTGATPSEGIRFWLSSRFAPDRTPPDALIVPRRIGPLRIATRGLVEAARRQGLRVQSWVANEWEEVEALRLAGLDAILTDRPQQVRRWLAKVASE